MANERIKFAYLSYTTNSYGTDLLGVYGSLKDAKSWFDLVNGEIIPFNGYGKNVLQKVNRETGQMWWVEKHVMRSGR